MSHQGKLQLTIVFKATTPELDAEGDRLFANHARWMQETHHRDGELALLLYNISKGVEYEDQMDPTSGATGSTYFVLTEVYESEAGVQDHWQMGQETWEDFGAFMQWAEQCETTVIHGCPVIHSLW